MSRSPYVPFRPSADLLAALDKAVLETGSSRSAVISEALRKHLKSKAAPLKRGRPVRPSVPPTG